MQFGKTEKTASLILGAAAGAAAMYFLDPKQGQARRDRIASAASDHLKTAKETAQGLASSAVSYGQQVAESAADFGHRATSHVAGHVDAAHAAIHNTLDAAHQAIHSGIDSARDDNGSNRDRVARVKSLVDQAYAAAKGSANDASDRGHSAYAHATETLSNLWSKYNPGHLAAHLRSASRDKANDLRDHANDAQDRGAQWVKAARVRAAMKLAPELSDRSLLFPVVASAVGCGVAGAGVMYFMDAERGADRRAMVADQARTTIKRTGIFFRASGKEIGDRLRGIQRQGKQVYQNTVSSLSYSSSDQLITAIRSALDPLVPEAHLLQLLADGSGRVTVSGMVPTADREKVISAIVGVKGVTEVINRLAKAPATSSNSETPAGVPGTSARANR